MIKKHLSPDEFRRALFDLLKKSKSGRTIIEKLCDELDYQYAEKFKARDEAMKWEASYHQLRREMDNPCKSNASANS